MKYQIYRLRFQTAVHFGDGGLMTGKNTLSADTLFSALCIEALQSGNEVLQAFYKACRDNELRFSDLLPFIGDTYYIPKPFCRIQGKAEYDSGEKKALKNLEYVPVDKVGLLISGELDVSSESAYFERAFGSFVLREKVSLEGAEPRPYAIETFRFGAESGLYLCIGFETQKSLDLAVDLLEMLSFTGIGGKISSGYGAFRLEYNTGCRELTEGLENASVKQSMLMSAALPSEEELDRAMANADVRVIKRSGFVASHGESPATRKKRDLYVFSAGSVFADRFNGAIYNVAPDGWAHPVYRYAKPLWFGLPQLSGHTE